MASESVILCMYSTAPDRMWRDPVCTTMQSSIRLVCSCFDMYALRLFIKLRLKFLIARAFPASKNSMGCKSAHSKS